MNHLHNHQGSLDRMSRTQRSLAAPAIIIAAFAVLGAPGCSKLGKYVWVDQYWENPPLDQKPYALAPGDVIQVRVFNQDQLSARVRVRPDGKVSLPLLKDVDAAGHTPVELSQILAGLLKEMVNSPSVTVSLEETKPQTVMIMGEVVRPNAYPLEPGMGVLQLLATAGGFTQDASNDRIFVLRQQPAPVRIRFSYEKLRLQEGRAATFRLRAGDVVVVE